MLALHYRRRRYHRYTTVVVSSNSVWIINTFLSSVVEHTLWLEGFLSMTQNNYNLVILFWFCGQHLFFCVMLWRKGLQIFHPTYVDFLFCRRKLSTVSSLRVACNILLFQTLILHRLSSNSCMRQHTSVEPCIHGRARFLWNPIPIAKY